MRTIPSALLLILFAPASAFAIDVHFFLRYNSYPRPEKAKISIVAPSKRLFLGEPIIVQFRVANEGKVPFACSVSGPVGEGRSGSRVFRVQFKQGPGIEGLRLNPNAQHNHNSLTMIQPGKHQDFELNLSRYVLVREPGTYTFRVTNDLGWARTKKKDAPGADITLEFVRPNLEQARKIVDEMPEGGLSENIHDSAYLPILSKYARDGDQISAQTIGLIPTVEATRELIALANLADNDEVAQFALGHLCNRIPDPQDGGVMGWGIWIVEPAWYWERTWRPELLADMRRLVLRRTKDPNPLIGYFATQILSRIAEKGDFGVFMLATEAMVAHANQSSGNYRNYTEGMSQFLPAFLKAETPPAERKRLGETPRWLASLRQTADLARGKMRNSTAGWIDTANPVPSLFGDLLTTDLGGAIEAELEVQRRIDLLRSGGHVPREPRSGAEIMAYLWSIQQQPRFRPKSWEDRLLRWTDHDFPIIRQAAIQSYPGGLPAKHWKIILPALEDEDEQVQMAALDFASLHKIPQFKEPIFRVLADTGNLNMFQRTVQIADAFDCRFDLLRAMAARLDEPDWAVYLLVQLIAPRLIDRDGHSMAQFANNLNAVGALAVKQQWLEFLDKNEKTLRSGKLRSLTDPILTPDLFPGIEFIDREGESIILGKKAKR